MFQLNKLFMRSGGLVLASFLSSGLLSAGEMRVWQSLKGNKITAEIISIGETSVSLITIEGKKVTVTFKQLVRGDLEYLAGLNRGEEVVEEEPEMVKEPEPVVEPVTENKDEEVEEVEAPKKEAEPAKARPVSLPLLKEGPGKRYHAYYEGEKYIAKMAGNGNVFVTIKDEQGKEVEGVKLVMRARSFILDAERHIPQPDEKLLEHGEPQAVAKSVTFKTRRKTGIICEVKYEFKPDGFSTWFSIVEGPKTDKKFGHHISHQIANLEGLSDDDAFFKKMTMKRKMEEGGRSKLDFNEDIDPRGSAEEYEFSGPGFGKLKIIMEKAKSEDMSLVANTYPGTPLKNGVSVYSNKLDIDKNDYKNERTHIKFK